MKGEGENGRHEGMRAARQGEGGERRGKARGSWKRRKSRQAAEAHSYFVVGDRRLCETEPYRGTGLTRPNLVVAELS